MNLHTSSHLLHLSGGSDLHHSIQKKDRTIFFPISNWPDPLLKDVGGFGLWCRVWLYGRRFPREMVLVKFGDGQMLEKIGKIRCSKNLVDIRQISEPSVTHAAISVSHQRLANLAADAKHHSASSSLNLAQGLRLGVSVRLGRSVSRRTDLILPSGSDADKSRSEESQCYWTLLAVRFTQTFTTADPALSPGWSVVNCTSNGMHQLKLLLLCMGRLLNFPQGCTILIQVWVTCW